MTSSGVAIRQKAAPAHEEPVGMVRRTGEGWRRAWRAMTSRAGRYCAFALALAVAIVFVLPLLWMVATSGKTLAQAYASPPVWWPPHFLWSNYPKSLRVFPYFADALNTLQVAVPLTIGTVVSSSLVAFGFGCVRWRGQNATFYLVLATLMVPTWVTIVPLYIMFDRIGWVNTFRPLWVPFCFGDPFSVFLLRQFFRTIPRELIAAARVDGASYFRIYRSVVLPLSRSALSVAALFAFIYAWTDFFLPLVYLNTPNKYTLQLGLLAFFGRTYISWPGYMAGSVLVLLPVVLLFLATQRTFIEGIATTGLRQ